MEATKKLNIPKIYCKKDISIIKMPLTSFARIQLNMTSIAKKKRIRVVRMFWHLEQKYFLVLFVKCIQSITQKGEIRVAFEFAITNDLYL